MNQATNSATESFGASTHDDELQTMSERAKQAAEDALNELKGRAGEYIERGREQAAGMAEAVEQQIRQRPMHAVAIAAGIGVALGYLWSRRS